MRGYFSQFGLIGLLVWPLAGQAAQSCLAANIPATSSHLVNNGNGTVSDPKTGLMWKQCSEGQSGADCAVGGAIHYTLKTALEQVATLNSQGFAGYTDWRIPNIKELRTIIERQCHQPSIRLDLFPNTPSSWYWSASPYAKDAAAIWGIGFDAGYDGKNSKSAQGRIRLVRGQ